MYNVLKYRKTWWNNDKNQYTWTATKSHRKRKSLKFSYVQYCTIELVKAFQSLSGLSVLDLTRFLLYSKISIFRTRIYRMHAKYCISRMVFLNKKNAFSNRIMVVGTLFTSSNYPKCKWTCSIRVLRTFKNSPHNNEISRFDCFFSFIFWLSICFESWS